MVTHWPRPEDQRLLTEAELAIMRSLWDLGPATAAQVKDHLANGDQLAYTTVSTMLRVLEQKGFVSATKQGRGHIYHPHLAKEDYQARTVHSLVERVFDGAPGAMVKQLLKNERLSDRDLAEIKALLQ